MKRLTCLMMALAIFFSLLLIQSPSVYAEDGQPDQDTLNTTPENTPAETPVPTPTETPVSTPAETPAPTPAETPAPTPAETPAPTPAETPAPTPESTPAPTPEPTPGPNEPSSGPFTFSSSGLSVVKSMEGFVLYPKWDYAQWTVGYGTKCPEDKRSYYMEHGISREEAEILLSKQMASFIYEVNKFISKNNLKLTQNQFDALVSFSYNVGPAWMYDSTGVMWNAIVKGYTGNELIRSFGRWSLAGGEVLTGLLRRRLVEANMYINGIYSVSPPANYCYVLFNANGGTVSPKSQAYDANDPVEIQVTNINRPGMTFAGWYTATVGGQQVTVLDSSVRNKTLYARWALDGVIEDGKLETPVKVAVTVNSINLRNGPGTNYGVVGGASYGNTFEITHVVKGGNYHWGLSGAAWLALEYTNYEEVKPEPPATEPPVTEPPVTEPPVTEPPVTEPPVTEPPVTEPPVTEPPVTEPPVTEPPVTEPPVTEPPVTEPPVTEPPANNKVMGTVKVPSALMIRKGPGTGYAAVGSLNNGTRVEILEQKTVGTMVWGRIDRGWISLTYVELDKVDKPEAEKVLLTGTVNCYCLIVRKGAGSSNAAVDYLYLGDKVEILEKKSVSGVPWGRTQKGWICLSYVNVDAETTPITPAPPVTEPPVTQPPVTTTPPATEPPAAGDKMVTGTVDAYPNLCIRTGPGTSYGVIGAYYSGTKVTILEQTTVGGITWGKTDRGWISMTYVKLEGKVTRTVNCNCLVVRKGAGTGYGIASYLYYGTKVEVLEQKTVSGTPWGRISSGWICLNFTK